jgi:PAS domain S-box-containing protein
MSSALPCLRKDGTVFYADIAGAISIIQGRRYAVGFFMDVSERRQAEENLRHTRNYLDNLINHANAPIIVWDPSFRITQFNGAFENFAGYSAQEVIGQQLDLLFPKDSCEESLSKIARTSGGEYWESVEIPILHKDGNIRIALWNSANIHAEDGATIVATIAQGQDITARNQAQQKLRESEENLRYLASQILTAQERERRRVSLELHDSAAQELSALKIGLENLLADSPEKPVEELNPRISGLLQGLQKTLSSIRTLSYDLRPPELEHFGLVQAIKTHCEEFTARTGIKVDFMATGIEAGHLDYDASINFYRIIQEGLTNVRRHSQAMNVNIRLVASFPKIILRLEDDGQGFDVMELEASRHGDKHLGLLGMRERVALLKGKIKIESQLEKGTKISIEIPWKGEDLGTKEETPHC